jgi:hypothetical protein
METVLEKRKYKTTLSKMLNDNWLISNAKLVRQKKEERPLHNQAKADYQKIINVFKVILKEGASKEFLELLKREAYEDLDASKSAIRYPSSDKEKLSKQAIADNNYEHRLADTMFSALYHAPRKRRSIPFPINMQVKNFIEDLERIQELSGVTYSIFESESPHGTIVFYRD